MKGTVLVRYTNGVGNNIFQYVFSRLLADRHGLNLSTDSLPILDVNGQIFELNPDLETVNIGLNELEYSKYFNDMEPCNFVVNTYGEDYTIYKPHIEEIRSWFADIPKTNQEDLAFHLRLGDRLLYKRDHDPCMRVEPKEYAEVFKRFDYNRLHIYTDMEDWKHIAEKEITQMKFHVSISEEMAVPSSQAVDYFNSLVDVLDVYSPIVHCGGNVKDAFNAIRSFDKIMFQHSTMSWWAAVLSHASRVGVFGPWRPIKGNRNKNLGRTDFPGWFSWGDEKWQG